MILEQALIEYCAPTLAGMKCGNLFTYYFSSLNGALKELTAVSRKLSVKGVFLEVLSWREGAVMLYVYRPALLERELKKEGILELLAGYGYKDYDIAGRLLHLKERLRECPCFPHEIGIFLGYPLEDVIGFIRYKGKNCKCSGFWKVYGNEGETRRYFEKLRKCTSIYLQVFAAGRSLLDMTVVA